MKRSITIVACFSVVIVLLYGVFSLAIFKTSAKYTDYKELNHFFESQELYINSDSLSQQENKYNIINYYNFTPIELNITNSISENQITKYDISYNLECNILDNQSNSYQCIIDDTEKNIVSNTLLSVKECIENKELTEEECNAEKYNYSLIKTTNKHTFKINNIFGNKEKLEVEIILRATSPYAKTLKSKYILNIGDDENNDINIAKVTDYNYFCEYNIINNYYANKKIKLSINTNKLIIDTTSELYNEKIANTFDNNEEINTITFILNKDKSIKLYKKDFSSNCNINDLNYEIIE